MSDDETAPPGPPTPEATEPGTPEPGTPEPETPAGPAATRPADRDPADAAEPAEAEQEADESAAESPDVVEAAAEAEDGGTDESSAAAGNTADEKTVVLDDTTVVLTNPRPERFAGLLPAPGLAGRRPYEPSRPRLEVQTTAADTVESGEDDAVQSEADGRPRSARRWAGGNRAAVLIGVLLALLGFGLAVQVRSNTATNGLSGARQEDLVRILDDLTSREERLRTQISSLEAARARLTTTGDKNTAALNEARTRSQALGVLAGTLPAQGPGITLTMSDPHAKLRAEDILDAVEELRAAGAEAIQVGQVRIGLNSSFIDDNGVIRADGQALTTPYQILAIGEAATLATALNIPGGVVDTVRQAGGQATITQQDRVVIRVLRSLSTPHYAQPAE